MEWDLKDFDWVSTELDPKEDDDLVLDFTTNPERTQKGTTPSSEALKVTSMANDPVLNKSNDVVRGSSGLVSSPSGSSKRPNGTQKLSCLVDGCRADLSSCREYHRRHRVCERHSKTPIVTVKGEEKRFCQQCSRFHSLGEFDEVKRSCRKRLDGHNRRRRKSQPEPLYFSSKNFLSSYKGPRILHFGGPQIYATASVRSMWPLETKTGSAAESWVYSPHKRFQAINQQSPPTSFNGGDKRLFFLQKNDPKQGNQTNPQPQESFLCHPFEPPEREREWERNNHIMSSEEISLPIDSGGRALYLLSTHPTQFSGLNQLGQPNESCPFQLLDYNLVKDKPVDPDLQAYDANKTSVYGNMMLRMGPDGLLEHGALQMLPISLE